MPTSSCTPANGNTRLIKGAQSGCFPRAWIACDTPPLSGVRDGNTLKVLFTGTVVCRGGTHESGTFIYSTRACSFLSSLR
jgi:hypothetical protein